MVGCSLFAFISSCVTQATPETRVCHSCRKLLQFTPDSTSFVVLSFAHLVLPVPSLSAATYALSPRSTQSPPLIRIFFRMSTNTPPQGLYLSLFHFGSIAHRDLSCVLVRWPWFHSTSFYNIQDRAFLVLPSFPISVPCTVQAVHFLFFPFFLSPVARYCALFSTYPSIPCLCASLSSSADPIFFVQC
jgi:hypothetical protein